jgi:uncharacterized protein (TIGR02172 family)
MQKGALIANGNTAEIYAWDDQHILKLFRDRYSQAYAEYEMRMANAVTDMGIASPAAAGLVQIDGRAGILYTRVEGKTMTAYWQQSPVLRLLPLARQTARLQYAIHTALVTQANRLPRQRQRLQEKIDAAPKLTNDIKQRALAVLDTLPDGKAITHGDFHPENVLMSPNGAVVIDWIDASIGNPLADVARTYILMTMGVRAQPAGIKKIVETLAVQLFLFEYLRCYCRLANTHPSAVRAWMAVVAAARLDEHVENQESALIAFVETNLR